LAGWWYGVIFPPKSFSLKSDSPIRYVYVCGWCDSVCLITMSKNYF
jgi:hypothetical protein